MREKNTEAISVTCLCRQKAADFLSRKDRSRFCLNL